MLVNTVCGCTLHSAACQEIKRRRYLKKNFPVVSSPGRPQSDACNQPRASGADVCEARYHHKQFGPNARIHVAREASLSEPNRVLQMFET